MSEQLIGSAAQAQVHGEQLGSAHNAVVDLDAASLDALPVVDSVSSVVEQATSNSATARVSTAETAAAAPETEAAVPESPFARMNRRHFEERLDRAIQANTADAQTFTDLGINEQVHRHVQEAFDNRGNAEDVAFYLREELVALLNLRRIRPRYLAEHSLTGQEEEVRRQNREIADRIVAHFLEVQQNPEPRRGLGGLLERVRNRAARGVRGLLDGVRGFYNHAVNTIAGRRGEAAALAGETVITAEAEDDADTYTQEETTRLDEFQQLLQPNHVIRQLREIIHEAQADIIDESLPQAELTEQVDQRGMRIADAREAARLVRILANADEDLDPDDHYLETEQLIDLLIPLQVTIRQNVGAGDFLPSVQRAETVVAAAPTPPEEPENPNEEDENEAENKPRRGLLERLWGTRRREAQDQFVARLDFGYVDDQLAAIQANEAAPARERALAAEAIILLNEVQTRQRVNAQPNYRTIQNLVRMMGQLNIYESDGIAQAAHTEVETEAEATEAQAAVVAEVENNENLTPQQKNWLLTKLKTGAGVVTHPATLIGAGVGMSLELAGMDIQMRQWLFAVAATTAIEGILSTYTRDAAARLGQREGVLGRVGRGAFNTLDFIAQGLTTNLRHFGFGFTLGGTAARYAENYGVMQAIHGQYDHYFGHASTEAAHPGSAAQDMLGSKVGSGITPDSGQSHVNNPAIDHPWNDAIKSMGASPQPRENNHAYLPTFNTSSNGVDTAHPSIPHQNSFKEMSGDGPMTNSSSTPLSPDQMAAARANLAHLGEAIGAVPIHHEVPVAHTPGESGAIPNYEAPAHMSHTDVVAATHSTIWADAADAAGGKNPDTNFLKNVIVSLNHVGTNTHAYGEHQPVIALNDSVQSQHDLATQHQLHPEAVGYALSDTQEKNLLHFYQEAATTDPAHRTELQTYVMNHFTGAGGEIAGRDELLKHPQVIDSLLAVANGKDHHTVQFHVGETPAAGVSHEAGVPHPVEEALKTLHITVEHPTEVARLATVVHNPQELVSHPDQLTRITKVADSIWSQWVEDCHKRNVDPMKTPPVIVDRVSNPHGAWSDVSPVRYLVIESMQHGADVTPATIHTNLHPNMTIGVEQVREVLDKVANNAVVANLANRDIRDAIAYVGQELLYGTNQTGIDDYNRRVLGQGLTNTPMPGQPQ